jgi:hypothetical protein
MYLLRAINRDRQTQLLNVLGQITIYQEGEKNDPQFNLKTFRVSKVETVPFPFSSRLILNSPSHTSHLIQVTLTLFLT